MNNFQIRKYSRCFFYLLLLLFVLLFATISLLIYIKPPSLTKKNFFTISSRSPEYLLLPIPAEKLLTVQEKNYPFSKISPKNKFYDIVTIIRDWELIKKNDNLFYAAKTIAELIKWDNLDWDKQLNKYNKYILSDINQKISISSPQLRLQKILNLNESLLSHKQKIEDLLYQSSKSDEEKIIFGQKISNLFSSYTARIDIILPDYKNAHTIYSLIDPLIDREFGIYESQLIVHNKKISYEDFTIDGNKKFIHLPNFVSQIPFKQKFLWKYPQDPNVKDLIFESQIKIPDVKRILAVINFNFSTISEIKLIDSSKNDNDSPLLFVRVFPNSKFTEIKKIVNIVGNTPSNQSFKLKIKIYNSSEQTMQELKDFSMVFYRLNDAEYPLLMTKKNIFSSPNIYFNLVKTAPFEYKLTSDKNLFFSERQLRYNINFGWIIKKNRLYFLPGILLLMLLTISIVFSCFLLVCLIFKKPFDKYLVVHLSNMLSLAITKIVSFLKFFKYVFSYLKLLFFLFSVIIFLSETFLHQESSAILVLITTIFWITTILYYSLESRFSLLMGLISFILSVFFLIIKIEIIADKFALWSIIFIVSYIVGIIVEIIFHKKFNKEIIFFLREVKDDYKIIYAFIQKKLKSLFTLFIPKTLTFFSIFLFVVKLAFFSFILFFIFFLRNEFFKYQQKKSFIPVIKKVEPIIVYPSTKVIIFGKNFGSSVESQLQNKNGGVRTEYWSNSKIIFPVSLDWPKGNFNFWIERKIQDGRQVKINKSKTFSVKIIPRGENFTTDDDVFFDNLKRLNKETRLINGYE